MNHPIPLTSVADEDKIIGMCNTCKELKYETMSHCDICERCFIERHHHCAWISTCVSLSNFKDFYLFLIYTIFFLVSKVKIHKSAEWYSAFILSCYFVKLNKDLIVEYTAIKNYDTSREKLQKYIEGFQMMILEKLLDSKKEFYYLLLFPFLRKDIYLIDE